MASPPELIHEITNEITPRWLSITNACRYSGMSDKTIMRYITTGKIYGSKKGGKWYIDRNSIDAFFKSDEVAINETLARLRGKIA
jgi:excisionase family DNA binding protein